MKKHVLTTTLATTLSLALGTASSQAATLVGHWHFNNQDLTETSGFQDPGTHDGLAVDANRNAMTASFSADTPFGSGFALDLTGGDYAVIIQNSNTQINGSAGGGQNPDFVNTYTGEPVRTSFSIAFWAKGHPTGWSPYISQSGEGNAGYQVRSHGATGSPAGSNTFTIRNTSGDDDPVAANPTLTNDDQWHHYAATWDGQMRRLYIDGVLEFEIADTGNMGDAWDEFLVFGGRDQDGSINFSANGFLLDDVRFYDGGLSQEQVLQIIPEPASLVLMGIGGLLMLRRRKQQ